MNGDGAQVRKELTTYSQSISGTMGKGISEGRSDVLIESGKMSQKTASIDTLCPFCPPTASCRPCNDTELLMAVCSSDFGEYM